MTDWFARHVLHANDVDASYAIVPQRFENWTPPTLRPGGMLDAQLAKLAGFTKP